MNSSISNALNLGKIGFIFIIVTFHSRLLDGILYHGYIGVEFFFIVSGYFLCKSALSDKTIITYIKERLKKLYPHYLFSFIVMILVSLIIGNYGHTGEEYNLIAELFMFQNLGLTKGGINYPCWYMSVLFWVSLLLFVLVKNLPIKMMTVLCATFTISYCLIAICVFDGRMEIWNSFWGIYLPVWRGFSGLGMGIVIYTITKRYPSIYKHVYCLQIIEILTSVAIMVFIVMPFNWDFVFLILFSGWIVSVLSKKSFFERIGSLVFFRRISTYEYAIFLNHAMIIMILRQNIFENTNLRVAILLLILYAIVLFYSKLTTLLVKKLFDYRGKFYGTK